MRERYRCTCCGRTVEGTVEELNAQGWKRRTRTKNSRNKIITACPEHVDLMRAELGGGE